MAHCETEDFLDYVMPKFKFKEGITPAMLDKMQNLPPKIRKRIMDARFEVDGKTMNELALGLNPQREMSFRQVRGTKEISETAQANRYLFENLLGTRRKKEAVNAETLEAGQLGISERLLDLAKNKDGWAEYLAKGGELSDDIMDQISRPLNEAMALIYQLRGAKAEAGRALNHVKRLNQIAEQTKGLETLFGSVGC